MKIALTIAGSDSGGGAGIQADIKTMSAMGVYAVSAITALTAQNTMGVTAISQTSPEFLAQQLDCIFTDLFPDAVKIGMVFSAPLIEVIADRLACYQAENIVLDPILASTSGTSLLDQEAEWILRERLFPLADVLTPNVPECERLLEMSISSRKDMEQAAAALHEQYHCAVVCKGGHLGEGADDLLVNQGKSRWFCGRRIDNPNNHGTGCTYSSALTACLAKGFTIEESVQQAKEYMNGALKAGLNLGKGNGPLNHFWK